jgi:hypothetical protein
VDRGGEEGAWRKKRVTKIEQEDETVQYGTTYTTGRLNNLPDKHNMYEYVRYSLFRI